MDEDFSRQQRAYLAFAERFDDLLSDKIYAVAAFGIVLAWLWMGLVKGHPAFMDGAVDLPSVAIMLSSFIAMLLLLAFAPPVNALLSKPQAWVISSAVAGVVCLLLIGLFYGLLPTEVALRLAVFRAAMVLIGANAALLVQCCAGAFAGLRPASAAVGFFLACVVMVVGHLVIAFGKDIGGRLDEGVLFCLLPVLAAALLRHASASITARARLAPVGPGGFAKGYKQMCVAFAIFFFAASAKAAMEPTHEFHSASEVSFSGILLCSFLMFYFVAVRSEPVGVFKLLKLVYGTAVLVLTVCIALAPLSLDPYMSIAFDADFMVLVMVLWLLMAFVANINESPSAKVFGVAMGAAALGLLLGWIGGECASYFLGHSRRYISVALACATAVFSTMGFSSMSFPYLTQSGKGAKKMRRIKEAAESSEVDYTRLLADTAGLSAREYEVLVLLLDGHNATSIAKRLVVSYHTARSHIRNIYAKLDVHSKAELLERRRAFPETYGEIRK